MAKMVMPLVRLESRPNDLELPPDQYALVSLFAGLKKAPSLDKYPGAVLLRRYRKGEVICRQGEPGFTAFYVLTAADALRLRQAAAGAPAREIEALEVRCQQIELAAKADAELAQLQSDAAKRGDDDSARQIRDWLRMSAADKRVAADHASDAKLAALWRDSAAGSELRRAATVYLLVPRPAPPGATGFFNRVTARLFGTSSQAPDAPPEAIPIDGPADIDYESRQGVMFEGELFGEMSCLYRTPRSATVVADRDCTLLEILRNVLDAVRKDEAYKRRMDEIYRQRVLELHLKRLSLFSALSDEQFARIRDRVELLSVAPGAVLFDEHDRSDSMFVIRTGLVKVVKNVSPLVGAGDVRDWLELGKALVEGESAGVAGGPKQKLWSLLPDAAKADARAAASGGEFADGDGAELLYAIAAMIKDAKLVDAAEFRPIIDAAEFSAEAKELLAARKKWTDAQARRFNRLLIEAVLPQAIAKRSRAAGPELTLAYQSRGDILGEMGLMTGQPRSATCIAYDHPGQESGDVELVKISAELFQELIASSDTVRREVESIVAARQAASAKRLGTRAWDDAGPPLFNPRFEELGLIQGQRLMLIDLDRCTRCDECVKACVATHDDGRSRLFLDGPRFGKYLVPTTCRSCLDPVCMIGCPVGSIHRGDNGEIQIRDWCIGCGQCANNCPYHSIQMHDVGVVPDAALGWRFMPAASVCRDDWQQPNFRDHGWPAGRAPLRFDRDLRANIAALLPTPLEPAAVPLDQAVLFRYEFQLARNLLEPDAHFKLEIKSADAAANVWINGREAITGAEPDALDPKKRKKDEWPRETDLDASFLRAGRNVIAARAAPIRHAGLLISLRLDRVPKAFTAFGSLDEVKMVTERAVVCDLCSSLPSQVPACVHACPHDAAMRVDARNEFPMA